MKLPTRTTCAAAIALAALLPLAAQAQLVSSGPVLLPGTFDFDFDTGTFPAANDPSIDVWWDQTSASTRALTPRFGATIVNLGAVSFAALSWNSLQSFSYSSTPISGSDVGNQLSFGDVFAVKTGAGNYAKAIVLSPTFDAPSNNGLAFYFETLATSSVPLAVPEPASVWLALAGGVCVLALARRRVRAARAR
jgi:hypothetical protein